MIFPSGIFRYSKAPSIRSVNSVTMTESQSLITLARALPAHRWDVEVDGIVLPWNKNEFNAFYVATNGQLTPFEWVIDTWGESQSSNTTTTATAAVGDSSISMAGTLMIGKGDFFNFGGHTKAYIVTDVVGAVVSFFPPLTFHVASAEHVEFESPTMTVRLRDNIQTFAASSARHPAEYSISMMEVL